MKCKVSNILTSNEHSIGFNCMALLSLISGFFRLTVAEPLSHARSGNMERSGMGSLPVRGLQSGIEYRVCSVREGRSGTSHLQSLERHSSMLAGGLVFSRKTTGSEEGEPGGGDKRLMLSREP